MLYILKAYTLIVNYTSVKLEGTRKEGKTLQKLYFLFFFNKCKWLGKDTVMWPPVTFNEESVVAAAGRTVGRQTSALSLFRDCPASASTLSKVLPLPGWPRVSE